MTVEQNKSPTVGEYAWVAQAKGKRKEITCPDCFGTGQLDVLLRNGEQLSIECRGCSSGYEPPSGKIELWEYDPSVEYHKITGFETNLGQENEYRVGHFIYPESLVFMDRAAAETQAMIYAKEATKKQEDRILRKEKDTRTWAWNASYHRAQIRKAQSDLEYHTKKLNAAKLHVKEEKAATV